MSENKMDEAFIQYAADILADTSNGLTGTQIIKYCNAYAVDFDVDTPITSPDFGKFGSSVPNKRTALYRNLREFSGKQQFIIIKELCELPTLAQNPAVEKLKEKLYARFSEFSASPLYIEEQPLTGWQRVDRAIEEMRIRLQAADNEEKCQAIGMIGRETLITIAQNVFDKSKHPTLDDTDVSTTDAKRMLEAYLQYELSDASEKARKFAKSAVDFSNQLTHDRNATVRDASICLVAIISVASLIKSIDETSSDSI